LFLISPHGSLEQNEFKALLATNTNAVFASIRGQAYEAHVHRNFKALSGLKQVKRLKLDGTVEDVQLNIPPFLQQKVFVDLKDLHAGDYGVPQSRTYESVDAVNKPNMSFQMSVTANHGYKVDGLEAVKSGLNLSADMPLHVVLVCPPDVTPHVKWQALTRGKKTVKRPQKLIDGKGLFQYCLEFPWN
jgi:hypothetical protein